LRLRDETAAPALEAALRYDLNAGLLRPRKLMKFALDHLHPENRRLLYDFPEFTNYPITCLWSKDAAGLLLRSFHLHPLMVDLSSERALPILAHDTIDGEFIHAAFADRRDIHIETDSDNILVFSLSSENDREELRRRTRSNRMRLRCMAYQWNVNSLHRWLITRAIKLHTEDLDESWERLEQQTGQEVAEALDISRLGLSEYLDWRWTVLRERALFELGQTRLRRLVHSWRLRLLRRPARA
jgi:hypothetical protein